MPAPTTTAEFLSLVRKSGIVDETRLNAVVDKLRKSGRFPETPGKLAGLLVHEGLLTHFQAEQLLQGKWRRFHLGKYRVLERLGTGGMGSVYLCEHTLMRRRVAVKVLPASKADEPSSLERFYREARAVASLDHINIVHAYDIDQDEGLHFLVMEYVDGASLQEIVRRGGPLSPHRAANYIRQAAEGLAHAHAAGIIHRDIKPSNLLVDRNGVVKILDMGLARFFNDHDDALTRKYDETVLGTADYLSPEQAVDSHEVDTRSDIYSLGATFYFVLTGQTPFPEGKVAQKLIFHQTREPTPIEEYRRDVPAELIAIVRRMMAKSPDDRYQHPLEVAKALEPWAGTELIPPRENELRQLSPAAMGESSPQPTPRAATRALASPSPVVASSIPKSVDTVDEDVVTKPHSSFLSPGTPPPEGPRDLPSAPHIAPAGESGNPWADLADETIPTVDGSDITPVSKPRKKNASDERIPLWRWLILIGGSIAAGVLIILLTRRSDTPPNRNAQRRVLVVSQDKGLPDAYRTIQRAMREARKNDIVELRGPIHKEHLIVEPRKGQTWITVRVAKGHTVVWQPEDGTTDRPLLQVSNASRFRLFGKGLTLDGKGILPELVRVSLACDGFTLKGTKLTGFTKYAIHMTNCVGTDDYPITIEDCTFEAQGNGNPVGIFFDVRPDLTIEKNDHIRVVDCRFPGFDSSLIKVAKDSGVLGEFVELP